MSEIILVIACILILIAAIYILQTARQQMDLSQGEAASQLELRKQAIEHTVAGLKEELGKYQQMLRESQGDHARKFGSLENELKNAHQATQKLQETTVKLNNILGNVKLRGQWGERMAEDIIRYAGLIENVNYLKQNVNSTATKPDYTFLLPQGHCINMDVKFPLDNYLQMVNAEAGVQRDSFEKEFIKNVKDRIKEIQNRDYINPSENTLDFVLLFIPNEQVFGLIQEKMPDVMDFALKQKVVLCSPFTLYAMLSVVRQAHEHFRFEKDIKKIIELIEGFTKDYELFKNRFAEVGNLIDKLSGQYTDITDKSFKKLDGKIQRIEDHKKGHLAIAVQPKDLIDALEMFFKGQGLLALTSNASIDFTPMDFDSPLSPAQRAYLQKKTGLDIPQVFWRKQVHGDGILLADGGAEASKDRPDADAYITDEKGLPIAIRTADCVPVFIFDPHHRAIGLAHAGWKGTYKTIAAKTVQKMQEKYASQASSLKVVLGPSIRECCYQVGKEFLDHFPSHVKGREGCLYADMAGANRAQLVQAGVPQENIFDSGICTFCHKDYFSFRRDGAKAGRMISLMMLV